ncbi:MarR family transcriptional regulator [Methylobacterium sp. Leaf99]|uniref:MarR family winged helix-turn-helix transcriptional regulator n=1 Tax=unclassified Methylobacterium TaxID=2615210 RepID=UPI000701AFAD|nr:MULTISPECIES: MarR family winged helix-turn-helix transcriptional regulator [unclassified Methylobacterium]KQP10951.1 MarR family transcriptional regulator [Methylobacterium sp. Leaf99]TXM70659.1 winged helix-turn-helix transcriptional regulator [Methylobacterium sp. WL69]
MMKPAQVTPCHCQTARQGARQLTQFYDRHLAPTGLRASQYAVLSRLGRLETASINQLAEALVMNRTTLGRALRPLQRDGLVRVGPGADGRTRALCLTAAGRDRLAAGLPLWRHAQDAFEAAFGAAEAEGLHAAMGRVVTALPG